MPARRYPVVKHCAAAALSVALIGCSDHARVQVHAFVEPGIPLTGLEVSALPFDAEHVLDSMGRAAASARPDFAGLEHRIQVYRRQDTAAHDDGGSVTTFWRATRDSVARLARELSGQDRRNPGYREGYARFRNLYARYTALEGQREARLRGFHSGDRTFAEEVTRASDSLRAWETEAYRDFPAVADARVATAGRALGRVRTDSMGTAALELANGDWWVTARIPDPDNPFLEFYWNVPVRISAGLPLSLPLMHANAAERWRH